MKLDDVVAHTLWDAVPKEVREMIAEERRPMTEVCSLRDRGEPQERDVVCTRPGPYGNPYTLERHGWKALDHYRSFIRVTAEQERQGKFPHTRPIGSLAGSRLLCACASQALACHAWILAEEVERLTGVKVKPAPGRERT